MNLFSEFTHVKPQDWFQQIEKDLKGGSLSDLNSLYGSGIEIKAALGPDDVKPKEPLLGFPESWHIVQYIAVSEPDKANKEALEALKSGASGLHLGLEKPLSEKECLELTKDISLGDIALYLDGVGCDLDTLQNLANLFPQQGEHRIPPTLLYDPIDQALWAGAWVRSEQDDTEIWNWTLRETDWNITINLDRIAQAGAKATSQLAIALSRSQDLIGRYGIKTSNRIGFQFSQGLEFFPELAKIRAIRRLWEFIVTQYELEPFPAKVYGSSNIRYETVFDAHTNLLRQTTSAMSGVLGGVDGFQANCFDRTFKRSSGFSRRMGRNIQLLLRDESFLGKQKDLGAGSYLIDDLTSQMENEAYALFQAWETKGGFLKCIQDGTIQTQIEGEHEAEAKAFAEGKKPVLGINKFPVENEDPSGNIDFDILLQAETDGVDFRPIRPQRLSQNEEINLLKNLSEG